MEGANNYRDTKVISADYAVGNLLFRALFTRYGISRLRLVKPLLSSSRRFGMQNRVCVVINQHGECPEEIRSHVVDVACFLEMLFNGIQPDIIPCIDLSELSENRKRVLTKTAEIPFGETRTYSWVAEESGLASGYRVVGRFLKENPVPLIIPCHRVIKADGKVGGYCFGESFKKNLIEVEKEANNDQNARRILIARWSTL